MHDHSSSMFTINVTLQGYYALSHSLFSTPELRDGIDDVNSEETFYLVTVSVSKCDGSVLHNAVTYSGCLGDWYTSLCAQTLLPKKQFSSAVFQQKIC